MYNLTRYKIGDRVIVGKDEEGGYPYLEGEIIGKAPRMIKLKFGDTHYFGSAQERWLPADIWYVVARVNTIS